jgi:aminoglycoside phosphotransferase (APT) family kinase protein
MPSQTTDAQRIEREKQIIKNRVGLADVSQIILNDRGWDSRVYSFDNNRYFFKFPRSEKIQNGYQYEIAAIKFIGNLNTDIIAQKILWEDPSNAYFGYEGVQGTPLSEVVSKLQSDQRYEIGKSLGSFLSKFHTLKLPFTRTVTIEDEIKQIQHWYDDSFESIHRFFKADEQRTLHHLVYEIWPNRARELGSEPVLCHGDLHFENILYGRDGTVGIIDFGDVAYYDKSKDFLELAADNILYEAALKAYGQHGENFMRKIAVRQAMIQMINLGFYAGKGDAAGINRTVSIIRSYL